MGYSIEEKGINSILDKLSETYYLYAPKTIKGGGAFSDTDLIKYGEISKVEEIEFEKKSEYSFKEILLPLSETLFFYTEDQVKVADGPKKGAIIFLRSCDLHSVKRLDEIYLRNGFEDFYYKRLRENVKFILMGCAETFENCFCVDMETNKCDTYDFSIDKIESNTFEVDNKTDEFEELFKEHGSSKDVIPAYVKENKIRVTIPEDLSIDLARSKVWDEYDSRCIACGRCNFVCPTCTCFTMQDVFYTDNGKVGERRRVTSSCMVDGFTEVAGGGEYRKKNGERMRFKVLHKVYDFKKKFGYNMCVGCGRCDDVCPEYIMFSNSINKLEDAVKEVRDNE